MPKLTGESQRNASRKMAKECSGRLSPTMLDVDLDTLMEVKKENDFNINFDNNLSFKGDTNREHKEAQFL